MNVLPRNILIVEDNIEFGDNLKDNLELEGYCVGLAQNSEEALEKMKNGVFPVVLLDLRLPGESGTTVLKRIKARLPDTQVIIMTAFASIESAIDALEHDAYSYLMKPTNMKELLIVIDRAFQDLAIKMEKERLLRDLTEANRKMMEQNKEIIEKNRELEAKNDELASFIYAVSHDLKSSLVTFHGYLDFINDMKLEPEVRKLVERLRVTASKMSGQIKDLLQISKVGNIREEKSLINPSDIIRTIIEELPPNLKKEKIEIKIDPDFPIINYSERQLRQVYENLITNALKFIGNTEKPFIHMGFMECPDDNNKYIFYVKDNGIGIDPAYHEKIFGIFQKLEEVPDSEGSGIGLSIVKRIVTNNGGKVWVESEKGKGSTFFFTVNK